MYPELGQLPCLSACTTGPYLITKFKNIVFKFNFKFNFKFKFNYFKYLQNFARSRPQAQRPLFEVSRSSTLQ